MRFLEQFVDEVPKQDSEDFTADEASAAVPTKTVADVVETLRGFTAEAAVTHDLRRWQGKLYWRLRAADRTFVFEVPWLDRSEP